jgi:hypothetical protein
MARFVNYWLIQNTLDRIYQETSQDNDLPVPRVGDEVEISSLLYKVIRVQWILNRCVCDTPAVNVFVVPA